MSSLLFTMVVGALSCDFKTGLSWEMLYENNIMLIRVRLRQKLRSEDIERYRISGLQENVH